MVAGVVAPGEVLSDTPRADVAAAQPSTSGELAADNKTVQARPAPLTVEDKPAKESGGGAFASDSEDDAATREAPVDPYSPQSVVTTLPMSPAAQRYVADSADETASGSETPGTPMPDLADSQRMALFQKSLVDSVLEVLSHRVMQNLFAFFLAAIALPFMILFSHAMRDLEFKQANGNLEDSWGWIVTSVFQDVSAYSSAMVTIVVWLYITSKTTRRKLLLTGGIATFLYGLKAAFYVARFVNTGEDTDVGFMIPITVFLVPMALTYWSGKRTETVLGVTHIGRALALYVFVTNCVGIMYIAVIPPLFFNVDSDWRKALMRLLLHPLMFEIVLLSGRVLGRYMRDKSGFVHCHIYVFFVQFTGSYWGRFLVANMDTQAGSILLGLALSLQDVLLRLTIVYRDYWIFYRPLYGKDAGRKIVKQDIDTGFRDHLLILDDIGESAAIITSGLMVYLVGIVGDPDNPNPMSASDAAVLIMSQLIMETGVDAAVGVIAVFLGKKEYEKRHGPGANPLSRKEREHFVRMSTRMVWGKAALASGSLLSRMYVQQLNIVRAWSLRMGHYERWVSLVSTAAMLFLLVSYVFNNTCPVLEGAEKAGDVLFYNC